LVTKIPLEFLDLATILPETFAGLLLLLAQKQLVTKISLAGLGVQKSKGWTHWLYHRPEPHILLLRRPLGTDPATGLISSSLQSAAQELYHSDSFEGNTINSCFTPPGTAISPCRMSAHDFHNGRYPRLI
jgi:hypothetical protein